jgi:hypothetical protein
LIIEPSLCRFGLAIPGPALHVVRAQPGAKEIATKGNGAIPLFFVCRTGVAI